VSNPGNISSSAGIGERFHGYQIQFLQLSIAAGLHPVKERGVAGIWRSHNRENHRQRLHRWRAMNTSLAEILESDTLKNAASEAPISRFTACFFRRNSNQAVSGCAPCSCQHCAWNAANLIFQLGTLAQLNLSRNVIPPPKQDCPAV